MAEEAYEWYALKKKINVDFRNYRILGACNPRLADEALQLEDKIGTMLPCNAVVQDIGDGKTEVAAIDPVASMLAIDIPKLKQAAERVRAMLRGDDGGLSPIAAGIDLDQCRPGQLIQR